MELHTKFNAVEDIQLFPGGLHSWSKHYLTLCQGWTRQTPLISSPRIAKIVMLLFCSYNVVAEPAHEAASQSPCDAL